MLDNNTALHISGLSKTFRIREKKDYSIRQRILGIFRPGHGVKRIAALQDINFDVKKGDFVGIVGANGSGKTTLLKIILGGVKPDKGSVIESDGKILRLALGIGFNDNLSARHNIYLNGSIMGLSFEEIGLKFHEILAFAELEEYVDTPIKFFSSGMYSRLAFSIIIHAKADILLIDEFFGTVGDESFRKKSQEYFQKNILHQKTVIFVSHNLDLIEKFCGHVYVLKDGMIVDSGPPSEVLESYKASFEK